MNTGFCLRDNRSISNNKLVTWCLTAGHKLSACKNLKLLRKGKLIPVINLEEQEEILEPLSL